MDRAKTILVLVIFIILLGVAGRMDKEDAQLDQLRSEGREWATFEEDEAFWNCVTMGNYRCSGNELP
jgi:hypothetical protein